MSDTTSKRPTNTNCLEGVTCPACGNEDTFRIEVTAMATVTDDGAEVEHGDMDWDETRYAECARCHEHGKLSHFMAPTEAPLVALPPIPTLFDVLLDIKCLAQKHDDGGYCPFTLLERIEEKALAALAKVKGGAQ
jgi:hypothetical protein